MSIVNNIVRNIIKPISNPIDWVPQGSLLNYLRWFSTYQSRVDLDSGVIQDDAFTKAVFRSLEQNGTYDNTKLLFTAEGGLKVRESGSNKFVTKGYDHSVNNNDLTQTTEANQPYLSGFIAPNEKQAAKNPNGEARYFTHPEISFASDEAWSVTTVFNWDGGSSSYGLWGKVSFGGLRILSNGKIVIYNNDLSFEGTTGDILEYIGKTVVLTCNFNGDGTIDIYINGSFFEQISLATNINITQILRERAFYLNGSIYYHRIQSGAMTPNQVSKEHTDLRALIPEIETIQIGTQHWATSNFEAVATPMGNVIAEMQDASAVEKITNGDFSSSTGWTFNAGWTYDGVAETAVCSGGGITGFNQLNGTVNRWYKATMNVISLTGGVLKFRAGGNESVNINTTGIVTKYIQCTETSIIGVNSYFVTSAEVDDISFEELGWADSQDLYDGLIAQGESVQTALEASAMWCYYNNDSQNGAIYGKLYNWFAVKLLQTDIDTYNASNPDWGYHVPTQAEFTTLQTYLGGSSVAGGKMKFPGTDYWNSPNTGATNVSGFSAIPGGGRGVDGNFLGFNTTCYFMTITSSDRAYLQSSNAILTITGASLGVGYSLRLLKD